MVHLAAPVITRVQCVEHALSVSLLKQVLLHAVELAVVDYDLTDTMSVPAAAQNAKH
jgi:hypothetical protein